MPLLALIVSNAHCRTIAWLSGAPFLSISAGVKWDAGIYLDIADNGYRLFRCGADPGSPFGPDEWCGNAGWFPLYPLLVGLLHGVGIPTEPAGMLVTQAATYAAFVLVWYLLGGQLRASSVLCLGLASVFPGSLYYHLTYPIALGVLAVLACVIALSRGSWVWAGAAGAVGAASYPNTATLIGLIPAVALLGWRDQRLGVRVARGIGGAALAALGATFAALTFRVATGHWTAYLLIQQKYGHVWYHPMATAGHVLTDGRLRTYGTPTPLVSASLNAPRINFVIVAVIVAIAVVATVMRLARATETGRAATLDVALLISTIVLSLIPLVAGPSVATYRSHALLLPSVVLLRDLPTWALGALLAACTVATAMLGAVFFHGILI